MVRFKCLMENFKTYFLRLYKSPQFSCLKTQTPIFQIPLEQSICNTQDILCFSHPLFFKCVCTWEPLYLTKENKHFK